MSVNKLERLLNLTAVLLNTRRPLAAEELREKVEGYPASDSAFHRAFERDKDDLRVLGIPLTVDRIAATDPPTDGYRIDPDDYYLPDPGLAPDELAALHLASLTVRVEGLGDREALWKLGGFGAVADGIVDGAGASGDESAPVLQGEMVASLPVDRAVVPLFQAISEQVRVRFTYRDELRTIDPWRLDFHRGRWYLTGYDHHRGGSRNYRLDRIESDVTRTGERAETKPDHGALDRPQKPWEVGAEAPTTATLLVDASRAGSARRQLGPDVEAEEQPDGAVCFTVPVVKYDAFRYFVLGFLEHAELVGPAEWRTDTINWLEAIVARGGEQA